MSIKTVSCPNCRTPANVMATMASAKCQSCGTVFPVSGAAATNAPAAKPERHKGNAERGSGNQMGHWLIVGGVTALALIGLAVISITQFGGGGGEEADEPEPPMREHATVVEELQLDETETPEFRIVKLPESTRKRIYRDYKKMVGSSFGKSKKIPKSGVAGQSLNSVLGDVVDNDVTKMALIHGITEEDIGQIYAEGQAKDW